jgi:tetratricopeptide (TPR) repeat protein
LQKDYQASITDNEYLVSHFRMRTDTIFLAIAKAKMEIDDFTGADRDLVKAISANPNNEEALILRAKISIQKDRASSAISYLQRIVRKNESNEEAWFLLGEIYFKQQIYNRAIENLDQSIKAKETAEAYYLRGACFAQLKDKNKACSDTQKAAEMGHSQAKKDVQIICR